jgi:hypothetical protein
MFGTRRKLSWRGLAALLVVLITMGTVISRVVDMQIFDKNFDRSAAFIESLRPNRPERVGAEEWNGSIDITVTAFCNVCTYDPKNDKSKKIISKILSLKKSAPHDPLGKLCKIWDALYYRCSPREQSYLDRYKSYFRVPCGKF